MDELYAYRDRPGSKRLTPRLWRLALVFVALAIIATACADSEDTTTTAAADTTAASTTEAMEETTTTGGEEATTTTASAEAGGKLEMPDDYWGPVSCDLSGQRVGVSSIATVEILDLFWEAMRDAAEQSGNGLEVVVTQADGDGARQVENTELYIAQDYEVVQVNSPFQDLYIPAIADATAKDIPIFAHSPDFYDGVTQNTLVDHYGAGYVVGQEAARWIDEHYDGATQVGVLTSLGNLRLKERSDGFIAAINEFSPNSTVLPEVDPGEIDLESSTAAAANLIQANPDIHVFFGFGGEQSAAINQALAEAGRTDPDVDWVGGTDGTLTELELIQSETSPVQATGLFPFDYSAVQLLRDEERYLCGGEVPPTRVLGAVLVTPENAAELDIWTHSALDPENAFRYPEVMHYFAETYSPGDPIPDTTG